MSTRFGRYRNPYASRLDTTQISATFTHGQLRPEHTRAEFHASGGLLTVNPRTHLRAVPYTSTLGLTDEATAGPDAWQLTIPANYWQHVVGGDHPTECWRWTGPLRWDNQLPHRVTYEAVHGPTPIIRDGRSIRRRKLRPTCTNQWCVNPWHRS